MIYILLRFTGVFLYLYIPLSSSPPTCTHLTVCVRCVRSQRLKLFLFILYSFSTMWGMENLEGEVIKLDNAVKLYNRHKDTEREEQQRTLFLRRVKRRRINSKIYLTHSSNNNKYNDNNINLTKSFCCR